jgi:hypothetical protein
MTKVDSFVLSRYLLIMQYRACANQNIILQMDFTILLITQNIINNYHINYLLHQLSILIIFYFIVGSTCTLYITNRVTGKSDSWTI